MTPEEMAKAGIWMLKQAIKDFLATQPGGIALTTTIRDELNLRCENADGERKDQLVWGLGNLLQQDGSVRKERVDGRNHLALNPATRN